MTVPHTCTLHQGDPDPACETCGNQFCRACGVPLTSANSPDGQDACRTCLNAPAPGFDPREAWRQIPFGIKMDLGAVPTEAVYDPAKKTLAFFVGNRRSQRKAIIGYLEGDDLYEVTIGRIKRGTYEWIVEEEATGIDAANLGTTLRDLHDAACEAARNRR